MSNDRDKALDMALSQIDKQFGKGSIMRMGEKGTMAIEAVSTGALSLDLALGIGGLPRGRVTEIYGPESSGKSTLAMHVVAEAQRTGGTCAYIDAEHAMDPVYAAAIGVDIDQLLISQPDTGEQALEIADMLVRSGAIDVVVVDSVAALTPRAEIEGEMGDSHVGLQARLMSQALRKLTGNLSKTKTIAIFINQLREKIGVMFGCFHYDTRVTLADGSQEKIGKIVNQRLPVEVRTYDIERGEMTVRPITNWFDNGVAERFLQFEVERGAGNGRSQFAATENHLISTPGGWKPAGELCVGDRVMQSVTQRLSPLQWEVVLGGLMGDGALSPTRSGHGARFRWGHGVRQAGYADWKASLFANIGTSRSTNDRGAVFHDLSPLPELAELREAVYLAGRKFLSADYLKQLTPLSLAVWYMDDGTFTQRSQGMQARTAGGSGRSEICVEAFDASTRERLVEYLNDTWGIGARLTVRGERRIAVVQFPTAESLPHQQPRSDALRAALSDPLLAEHLPDAHEIDAAVTSAPRLTEALTKLHAAYRDSTHRIAQLESALIQKPACKAPTPLQEVRAFFEHHGPYFDPLDRVAEHFATAPGRPRDIRLGAVATLAQIDVHVRFDDIAPPSLHDPENRQIVLSTNILPADQNLELLSHVASLRQADLLDRTLAATPFLTPEAKALTRQRLATYFAAACLMPYARFSQAAARCGNDLDALAQRFTAPLAQVCQRLSSLSP